MVTDFLMKIVIENQSLKEKAALLESNLYYYGLQIKALGVIPFLLCFEPQFVYKLEFRYNILYKDDAN